MKTTVNLNVNGTTREIAVSPKDTLLETLRVNMGLTGTKEGCGEGECGTCTVLLNGLPINSCLTLAVEAEGHEIVTIEGIAKGADLHPLQEAFVDRGAIQCGFCTPGMILTSKALIDANPVPTRDQIRDAISGNLCRCTGYHKIVDAVEAASVALRADKGGDR